MKLTTSLIGLATITAGLCVTQAFAQGPPDPAEMVQRRVERLNDELKLTKAQQKQITSIYMDAQTASQQVRGGMREANQALVAAIKSNDANGISQAANNIGSLYAQMTVANAKAEAAVYAALTPDQQAKWQPMVGGMGGGGMYGGGRGGRGRGGPPQQ